MQEAVGLGVNLLVALDAVHVEAHAASCLYEDLCKGKEDGALNKDL
jgi:hypothetical protein